MSEEQNKELVRRAIAAEDRDDHDEMLELLGPEWEDQALWHAPHHLTDPGVSMAERFQQALDQQNRVFAQPPQTTIDEMIAAGDRVITVATVHATHRSGTPLTWRVVRIDRIANGKIAETHTMWDRLGFWQQLGVVPETSDLMARSAAM